MLLFLFWSQDGAANLWFKKIFIFWNIELEINFFSKILTFEYFWHMKIPAAGKSIINSRILWTWQQEFLSEKSVYERRKKMSPFFVFRRKKCWKLFLGKKNEQKNKKRRKKRKKKKRKKEEIKKERKKKQTSKRKKTFTGIFFNYFYLWRIL